MQNKDCCYQTTASEAAMTIPILVDDSLLIVTLPLPESSP